MPGGMRMFEGGMGAFVLLLVAGLVALSYTGRESGK